VAEPHFLRADVLRGRQDAVLNYILIGFLSGVVSGAGMGGGTVLIPLLTLLLGTPQKEAQTINFLAYLPAAAVALLLHAKKKRCVWQLVLPVLPWGFLGALAGLVLALIAPQELLKKLFGAFLVALSVVQWINGNKKGRNA
jgi:uncharacterized membrane protein YfcA